MKLLCSFMLLLATAFVISSCQKELSFEAGLAKGTLAKDALGDCMPITVTGSYQKDTLLKTTTNYVDVQVNITQIGSYSIKTDTLNGYSFSAAGFISVPGLNTVRLLANGRPVAPALDVFTVRYDSSVCQFDIVVTGAGGGGGGTAAVYTLVGSPSTCTGAKQSNNFFANVPTTPANRDTVYVNVTQAGTYSINTGAFINGLQFSASGTLAVGNNVPIILIASGSPTAAGTNSFPLITSSPNTVSNCGFTITTQGTPGPATFTINCATPATQTGTFQAGTPLNFSSKITLSVTPATTGVYSITTNTVNGVSYIGAGNFTNTTTQNVDLYASPFNNTPIAAGTFQYTTTGGTVPCNNVSVTYTGGGTGAATDSISATINGTFKLFDDLPSIQMDNTTFAPFIAVVISGDSVITSTEGLQFGVANATGIFAPIFPYTVNQGPAVIVGGSYTDDNNVDYISVTVMPPTPTPAFTVTFTSISGVMGASGTRVKGTFSGAVKENGGTVIKTITGGYFDLTFP